VPSADISKLSSSQLHLVNRMALHQLLMQLLPTSLLPCPQDSRVHFINDAPMVCVVPRKHFQVDLPLRPQTRS